MSDTTRETNRDAVAHEWVTLQNNYEQYERSALHVKLIAAAGFAIGLSGSLASPRPGLHLLVFMCLQCVLWLQEGILRTSQARLGQRLLRVEALQRDESTARAHDALQLHSEWQADRAGSLGLLAEYARNALRPTVAFPHALLVALWALSSRLY